MAEQQIYFRPGLIILMDKASERVYEYLLSSQLLEHLDEPLRHCVGCAQIVKEDEQVRRWLLSDIDLKTGAAANVQQDTLDETIRELLIRITNQRSIKKCTDAGYKIGMRQIYIVGSTSPMEMHAVLQKVQEHLQVLNFEAEISYILLADARTAMVQYKGVKVCYLYGDRPGAKNDQENVFYAAAEALFALVATDITLKPEFQQAIQPWSDDITTTYGTLSSCRFTFPYEMIQSYSRTSIAQHLINEWLQEIQYRQQREQTSQSEGEETRRATQAIQQLEQRLYSGEPLPDTYLTGIQSVWKKLVYRKKILPMPTETFWPHPEISKAAKATKTRLQQPDGYDQLRSQTRRLFELISFQRIQKASRHSQTWVEAAEAQWKKAEAEQKNWQDVAIKTWADATHEAVAFVLKQVDEIWDTANDFVSVIKYVNTIYQWLDKQKQKLQARSDHNVQLLLANEVAEKYGTLSSAQQQVRTKLSLPAFGFLITPVLIILVMAALAPLIGEQPQLLFWLVLASTLCTILAGFGYIQSQQQQHVLPAQVELLNFYHSQLMQLCKKAEEEQRLAMIQALLQGIKCITPAFLSDMQTHFTEAITREMTTLIDSTRGSRDTFICDGQYFQNATEGHAVLKQLVQKVETEMDTLHPEGRKKTSFEKKSAEALRPLLQDDLTNATLADYSHSISTLVQEDILTPFLKQNEVLLKGFGSIDEKRWKLIVERLQEPFSSVQTGIHKPTHIFLCGSNPTVKWVHFWRSETIAVPTEPEQTKQSEWLLVVGLYCTHAS